MLRSVSRVAVRRVTRVLTLAPTVAALGGCQATSSAPSGALAPAPAVERAQASNDKPLRGYPGVAVARTPTGGVSIRILSALVGGGPPLYIIDGAPVFVDPARGIDWLKLEDVVQVKLLKRPSETAVYGPRGVNGVVLVTTKQGKQ